MGTETDDEVDTQEEEEDNGETDNFESQVNLDSSTQKYEASINKENGFSDRFVAVRTINKTIDGIQHSLQESS